MRLFVAIELPEEARRRLESLQKAVQKAVHWSDYPDPKWIRHDQMHLTLKFLGDTPDESVPALVDRLRQIRSEPIQLALDGVICFPERGPIRVIAASMVDCEGRCTELQKTVDDACQGAGFRLERRRWVPHATLCRIKQSLPSHWRKSLTQIERKDFFTVSDFSLVESRLSQAGPEYATVARF
jgi:2'-5' RNA ligase